MHQQPGDNSSVQVYCCCVNVQQNDALGVDPLASTAVTTVRMREKWESCLLL